MFGESVGEEGGWGGCGVRAVGLGVDWAVRAWGDPEVVGEC